jgi:hypothetical protein
MKKKKTKDGRAVDRIRKTIPFPDKLAEQLQQLADEQYAGDFTRAVIAQLGKVYPVAREFLKTNQTFKHSAKK